VENTLANLLLWVSWEPHPGLEQASNLLLNLGGAELIDAPIYTEDGYNILQQHVGYAGNLVSLCSVLSKGPDLYRLGVDHYYTPRGESPTSLSMYSSWAFSNWLDGLDSIQVDLQDFVKQELERNHAVHPGWKKETLLDLFAYDYSPDFERRYSRTCSDCSGDFIWIKVQPYWRHYIERIRQGLDPKNPALVGSEAGEEEDAGFGSIAEAPDSPTQAGSGVEEEENADSGSIAEAASSSSDRSIADPSELSSDSDEEDIHGYPATVSIRADCVYAKDEMICMKCWVHYRKHGTRQPLNYKQVRAQRKAVRNATKAGEDSSMDEYSPFLIHS